MDAPISRRCRYRSTKDSENGCHHFREAHFGIQVLWIYVVGIACAVFHFANGLWNAAIHWGLTISPRSQRISGLVCGLVGVTLLAVGLATLLAFTNMQV